MGVLTEVTLADLTLLQQAIPVQRKLGIESRYSIGPLDDGDVEPVDLVVLRQEPEGADVKEGEKRVSTRRRLHNEGLRKQLGFNS